MSESIQTMLVLWMAIGFLLALGGVAVLLQRAERNTYDLRVVEVNPHPQTVAKTEADTLRVLQISDMHLELLSVTPEQIARAMAGQPLDLIALTGDFLDRRRSLPKLVPYLQMLQSLNPTFGMFAVLGNHDYLLRPKALNKLRELLAAYGVRLLENEHVSLLVRGRHVHLIGVDDFSTGRSDLQKSYAGVPPDGYHLILTHDPNLVLHMGNNKFDYLIAGHFHGGQIHWPKPFHMYRMGELARQRRVSGLHVENGRAFYINQGLGQTGLRLRLGTRPELTIHHLPHPTAISV